MCDESWTIINMEQWLFLASAILLSNGLLWIALLGVELLARSGMRGLRRFTCAIAVGVLIYCCWQAYGEPGESCTAPFNMSADPGLDCTFGSGRKDSTTCREGCIYNDGSIRQSMFYALLAATVSCIGMVVHELASDSSEGCDNSSKGLDMLKIVVSFVQVMSEMQSTFRLKFPVNFQWLVELAELFKFDIFVIIAELLPRYCIQGFTFTHNWYYAVYSPLTQIGLLGLLLGLLKSICKGKTICGQDVEEVGLRVFFFAIFLLFPTVMRTMINGVLCRKLGAQDSRLLNDLQVKCFADEGGFSRPNLDWGLAGVYSLLIPLGIIFWLRVTKPGTSCSCMRSKEMQDWTRTYSFLVKDYKDDYYYWDGIEMGRKVVLTGMLAAQIDFQGALWGDPGSLFQLVMGILISLIFMTAVTYYRPYRQKKANLLKSYCDGSQALTLLLAVMLKIDLRGENIDETTLGTYMLVATIAPFVVCFFVYPVYKICTDRACASVSTEHEQQQYDDEDRTTSMNPVSEPEPEPEQHGGGNNPIRPSAESSIPEQQQHREEDEQPSPHPSLDLESPIPTQQQEETEPEPEPEHESDSGSDSMSDHGDPIRLTGERFEPQSTVANGHTNYGLPYHPANPALGGPPPPMMSP
eukprot:COSAG01_NODE_43_length_32320_cov_622.744763_33_plen_636_part_01